MRVGFFTWAKDWVSIDTLLTVQRIALVAASEKSVFKRVSYVWKIVKLLTEHRNPFSIFLYPRIVAAFNFKPDKSATVGDVESIEKKILALCSDIASRAGKLPREVVQGMAFDETQDFYKRLILREFEKSLSLMSAYHAPEKYGKSVMEKIRKIQNELERAVENNRKALTDSGGEPEKFEPVKIAEMFPRFA
jgi:hypothetical protein